MFSVVSPFFVYSVVSLFVVLRCLLTLLDNNRSGQFLNDISWPPYLSPMHKALLSWPRLMGHSFWGCVA